MGRPYGSIPRKTVPRPEESSAMDFAVLWDFGVSFQCTASSKTSMYFYCKQTSLKIFFCRVMLSTQSSFMATTTTSAPLAGSSSACHCPTSLWAWVRWPTATWWSFERRYMRITSNFSRLRGSKMFIWVYLLKDGPECKRVWRWR